MHRFRKVRVDVRWILGNNETPPVPTGGDIVPLFTC